MGIPTLLLTTRAKVLTPGRASEDRASAESRDAAGHRKGRDKESEFSPKERGVAESKWSAMINEAGSCVVIDYEHLRTFAVSLRQWTLR